MDDWLSFAWSAAAAAVSSGRIGHPVSLRLLDFGQPDHGALASRLAMHADRACTLLKTEPDLLWAARSPDSVSLDVHLRGAGGQSLLLSAAALAESLPDAGLMVVGQHGIADYQADSQAAPANIQPVRLSHRGQMLLAAIESSAQTGEARRLGAEPATGQQPFTLSLPRAATAKARPAAPLSSRPLGVLLVSGGQTHQEMYAPAFAADARCRLVGMADENDVTPRRRELNAQLAGKLAVPVLPSLDQALARDDVHVVSICAEPERRAQLILRALAAGKHLYLDKPLAASIDEASRIRAAAQAAGVFTQMFSLIHMPAAQSVRSIVESGRLGELIAVHCDLFFAKGPAGTARPDRPRREQAEPSRFEAIDSKRELYNIGVYPLAMLAWLLDRKVRRVVATTGNYFFAEHERSDMEDFAQLALEFESGPIATICVGRTGWQSHPAGGVQRTWLVGSRGCTCIDAYRPRLEIWSDAPAWSAPARSADDPMGFWVSTQQAAGIRPKQNWLAPADEHADVRHFVDCLTASKPCDLPAQKAADVLEVLLAAYRSAATGQPVVLA